MDDYLEEAKHSIERAQVAEGEKAAQANALLGIACALVVLAEGQAVLIKQLDELTEFSGGKMLYVKLTEK